MGAISSRRQSYHSEAEKSTNIRDAHPKPTNSILRAFGIGDSTLTESVFHALRARHREQWRDYTRLLNAELLERAPGLYTRLAIEVLLGQSEVINPRVAAAMREWEKVRTAPPAPHAIAGRRHHGDAALPFLDPVPELHAVQSNSTDRFARNLLLWPRDLVELAGFGGEMDRAVQMPGWTNVWTTPIQNRIDMLSTGVNTTVGVRVLGRRSEDVARASEDIAALLKTLPGSADVIADPVRGKGYLEVVPDREKMARLGVDSAAVSDAVEMALGGRIATNTVEGRERYPVRVVYARTHREDEETIRQLPIPLRSASGVAHVPLYAVANVRVTEGPAAIKGENGELRNCVRLNVRGRDSGEFVDSARQAVAAGVHLPEGVHVEWTGQFEQEARASRTLTLAIPAVVALIFLIL